MADAMGSAIAVAVGGIVSVGGASTCGTVVGWPLSEHATSNSNPMKSPILA